MTRYGYTLTILFGASLGVAACTDNIDTGTNATDPQPTGTTTGSDGNTFDHDNSGISVWDLIDRLTKEGPPSFSSQMHGCTKPTYASLKNILVSVGVQFPTNPAPTATSAAGLYNSGAAAMGAPNYGARVRENLSVTTSGASREFDVFAAAATEVITNLPNLARCKDAAGTPAVLFDTNNQCQASGITCILGVPATPDHIALCNQALQPGIASTTDIGKRMAVAAMLAAAYTCP